MCYTLGINKVTQKNMNEDDIEDNNIFTNEALDTYNYPEGEDEDTMAI